MEESRGGRLQRNLEALQADLALAQSCRDQLDDVSRAAEQYIADQHRRMAQVGRAGRPAFMPKHKLVGWCGLGRKTLAPTHGDILLLLCCPALHLDPWFAADSGRDLLQWTLNHSCTLPSWLQEDQAVQEQAERRTAVAGMRQAVHEEAAANEQRRRQLAQAQERVAKLRVRGRKARQGRA